MDIKNKIKDTNKFMIYVLKILEFYMILSLVIAGLFLTYKFGFKDTFRLDYLGIFLFGASFMELVNFIERTANKYADECDKNDKNDN